MTSLSSIRIDDEYVSIAFAYVLTQVREAGNLSEDEFAAKIGVDLTHCREIESGAYGPSLYFLLKLAAGMGCKPEDLITASVERLTALTREKHAAEEAWAARGAKPKAS